MYPRARFYVEKWPHLKIVTFNVTFNDIIDLQENTLVTRRRLTPCKFRSFHITMSIIFSCVCWTWYPTGGDTCYLKLAEGWDYYANGSDRCGCRSGQVVQGQLYGGNIAN